jgi:hypothetical protein
MRKQLLLGLCLLLLLISFTNTLASRHGLGNRPRIIPIQLTERGHIFVPVRVNNSEPLWFVLDSGSADTVLNKRLVEKLNLKVEATGEAEGGGGVEEAILTSGVTLNLSGLRLPNLQVPALDFKGLEASLGRDIDGMLGYDFIRRFVVEVNYEGRAIKIFNAATYRYRGRGESLPITTDNGQPHIRLKVALPGRGPIRGKFIVDGGAGGTTLEFASPFVQRQKLLDTIELLDTTSLAAIGGSVNISYGRGKNIQLGRFLLENPIVGFSQAKSGSQGKRNIAGLIGAKLLRRFTIIYDDKRRRIIFEPNNSFAQPE